MHMMSFDSFKHPGSRPLMELVTLPSDLEIEELIGGLEDLGINEKRWTWPQIESAWHKMSWEEILEFIPNDPVRNLGTFLAGHLLTVTVDRPFLISVQGDKMAETLAHQLLKISSAGTGNPTFTLSQILATVAEMTGTGSSASFNQIRDILAHLVKELRFEEDDPNLWLNLQVSLKPTTSKPGNSKFLVEVTNIDVQPNWDQVADLMCDPRMLKEFKRELYGQANI